jgi:hypothetical protein
MTFLTPSRYYNLSPWLAWPISVFALVLSGFLMVKVFDLGAEVSAFYYLVLLLLLPVIMFLSTPFMRVAGIYKYYSPLFLTFGETNKRFEIPNVLKVKRASMTGQRLLEHREYIERLYDRMATERNRAYQQQ